MIKAKEQISIYLKPSLEKALAMEATPAWTLESQTIKLTSSRLKSLCNHIIAQRAARWFTLTVKWSLTDCMSVMLRERSLLQLSRRPVYPQWKTQWHQTKSNMSRDQWSALMRVEWGAWWQILTLADSRSIPRGDLGILHRVQLCI